MISLFVLVVSFIPLWGVSWLGVQGLSSWREAGRGALVTMFLFTGASHFTSMKHDFAAMIPDALPDGLWGVYLTGVRDRRCDRFACAPYPVARGYLPGAALGRHVPANVNATLNEITLGNEDPTSLWLRTPMQLFYIGMVWWTSVKKRPEEVEPPPAEEPAVTR